MSQRKAMTSSPPGVGISLAELPNSTTSARRFVLRLHDITEQERLLREMRTKESMGRSGMLLAGAAHQAKILLFGLSATLQALQASHSAAFDQDDPHLRNLRDGIARMEAMVRNVFAQSRPRGKGAAVGRCDRRRSRSRMRSVGHVPKGEHLHRYAGRCPGLGRASAVDTGRRNLIDNAVRYSPEGSTVTVDIARSSGKDGCVSIRIADRGTGFRARSREAFHAFLYAPSGRDRPGLGGGEPHY